MVYIDDTFKMKLNKTFGEKRFMHYCDGYLLVVTKV